MPASGGSLSDTNVPTNKVVNGQSHYLAYITPDEGKSLVNQGGKEVITDSGVPAYPGHHGVSGSSAGVAQGGSQNTGSDRGPRDAPDRHGPVATPTPRHHTVDTPTQVAEQTQLDTEARARQFD